MATYERAGEVKKMGVGGLLVRAAAIGALGLATITGGNYILGKVRGDDSPTAAGFVSPKALSIQSRKDAGGNVEAHLQYKHGDEADLLPCKKGYSGGVLCGSIDYFVQNLSPEQRENVVVEQFPQISNTAKKAIVGTELQGALDSFYGAQKPAQPAIPAQQLQYGGKQK